MSREHSLTLSVTAVLMFGPVEGITRGKFMTITIPDSSTTLRRPSTRVTVLPLLGMLAIAAAVGRWWRRYRTKRALMALSAWQRADCGINRPDIPSACDMVAAARRRIANGMPTDWC